MEVAVGIQQSHGVTPKARLREAWTVKMCFCAFVLLC